MKTKQQFNRFLALSAKYPWILPLIAVIILGIIFLSGLNHFADIFHQESTTGLDYLLFVSLPLISLVAAALFLYIALTSK